MEEEIEDVDQSPNSVPILLDLAFASNVCSLSKYQYKFPGAKKLFDSDKFPVEGSLPGRPRDVHEQQHWTLQDSSLCQRGQNQKKIWLETNFTKIKRQFDQNLRKGYINLITIWPKIRWPWPGGFWTHWCRQLTSMRLHFASFANWWISSWSTWSTSSWSSSSSSPP